jgi:hypothetical protein
MALKAEERDQLLLLERPRPLAVQKRRTTAVAAAAGRVARPFLMCHWHPASQDQLECRWAIESIAGTGALRVVGDNDQTTADARTDSVRARGPAPQELLGGKSRAADFPPHDRNMADELRRQLRRQDAVFLTVGLLLFAVAAAATYLCWDYARPFVATDDPFLAARQFPIVVRTIPAPSQHRLTLDNERATAPTRKTVGQRSGRSEALQPTPDPAALQKRLDEKISAPGSPERRGAA